MRCGGVRGNTSGAPKLDQVACRKVRVRVRVNHIDHLFIGEELKNAVRAHDEVLVLGDELPRQNLRLRSHTRRLADGVSCAREVEGGYTRPPFLSGRRVAVHGRGGVRCASGERDANRWSV